MPEIRYNLISKKDVQKFVGKARIKVFVFYLIKWKQQTNKSLTWQSTSIIANVVKMAQMFNNKIVGIQLPYINSKYRQEGLKLLENVDHSLEKEKRMWKIEQIIGKRHINGYIHYFFKWENRSIFESDWVSAHGLWRLYPEQLKTFKTKVSSHLLPYVDQKKVDQYIQIERDIFQRDSQYLEDISERIKQLIRVKTEEGKHEALTKAQQSEVIRGQVISNMIRQLRQKLNNPVQSLYLKTECKEEELSVGDTAQMELKTGQKGELSDSLSQTAQKSGDKANQRLRKQSSQKNVPKKMKIRLKKLRKDLQTKLENSPKHDAKMQEHEKNKISTDSKQKNLRKQKIKQEYDQPNDNNQVTAENYDNLDRHKVNTENTEKKSVSLEKQNERCEFLSQDKKNPQKQQIQVEFANNLIQHPSNKLQTEESPHLQFRINENHIFSNKTIKTEQLNEKQQKKFVKLQHQQQNIISLICNLDDSCTSQQKNYQKDNQEILPNEKIPQLQKTKNEVDDVSPIAESCMKIASIRLFAENITSLQANHGLIQNLYEVKFNKILTGANKISHESDLQNKKSSLTLRRVKKQPQEIMQRFFQTSYLKKYHNDEFVNYLENQIKTLQNKQSSH